jgi:hypothetical protein
LATDSQAEREEEVRREEETSAEAIPPRNSSPIRLFNSCGDQLEFLSALMERREINWLEHYDTGRSE